MQDTEYIENMISEMQSMLDPEAVHSAIEAKDKAALISAYATMYARIKEFIQLKNSKTEVLKEKPEATNFLEILKKLEAS